MKLPLFYKIIDSLKEFSKPIKVLRMNKIGEPLLNKNLAEMIQYQLCDYSKLKQSGQYKHLAILPPDSVKPNGILVISPYLHRDAIYDSAISFGWPLENIFHLS